MKDFLGKELVVGDTVVYLQHNKTSSELIKAVVVGFTPKKVRLQEYYGDNVTTKYSDLVVKVEV